MPNGEADAHLFTPAGAPGEQFPGVIDLPDIRGIREATLAASRRVAEAGYTVLSPNPFYRTARSPVFDFPLNFAEERTQRRYAELTGPLTPEAMHADAQGYLDALSRAGAQTEKIGIIGHCFTGAQALRTAAALPARVGAIISLHGGHLFTAAGDPAGPHRELARVKASAFFAHAKDDNLMPAEAIHNFEIALADWGGTWESEVFPARHGWTVTDSASYNPAQADRAFSKMMALFAKTLHGS